MVDPGIQSVQLRAEDSRKGREADIEVEQQGKVPQAASARAPTPVRVEWHVRQVFTRIKGRLRGADGITERRCVTGTVIGTRPVNQPIVIKVCRGAASFDRSKSVIYFSTGQLVLRLTRHTRTHHH